MAGDKGDTATAKSCFIIMPISTPEGMLAQYRNDTDHFQHVLDHLLIPAVEKAGLKPIPPKSKGSEVIHGDIVKKIESSDLVLCDMSTLNANVFFELGIRTSLNKPVCLVKDNLTDKVPFDTGIINYHTYLSALNAWELGGEIEKLSAHVQDAIAKSSGKNSMWKYFGLSVAAEAPVPKGGETDRLEFITLQLESLRKKLDDQEKSFPYVTDLSYQSSLPPSLRRSFLEGLWGEQKRDILREQMDIFLKRLFEILVKHKITTERLNTSMPNKVVIKLNKKIEEKVEQEMMSLAFGSGMHLEIEQPI